MAALLMRPIPKRLRRSATTEDGSGTAERFRLSMTLCLKP